MNKLIIESRRKKETTLFLKYGDTFHIDVTSKAPEPWVRFSPFFPHGEIPIANTKHKTAMCVEGIWQGLKVFKDDGVDMKTFANDKMKNIKRSVRKNGVPLGHQYGLDSTQLLTYIDARRKIYLPAYQFVLDNYLQKEIEEIRNLLKVKSVLLLDYERNCDIDNAKKPLSHAYLIKAYIDGDFKDLFIEPKKTVSNQISMF